jgi:hypothetical protein
LNTKSLENAPEWSKTLNEPVDFQLEMFESANANFDLSHIKNGFRPYAACLFERGLIAITDYVSIFGGNCVHHLTLDKSGQFQDMRGERDVSSLTEIYSRAKHGSMIDIRFLAGELIGYLCKELDTPDSNWLNLFQKAKSCDDRVVLMTTGWRNVPSMANILYEIVVEEVNVKLAHLGLPTIINVKLPRIEPPCENYATLSIKEREDVNLVQDHVIPGENFYRGNGVHVIFGDDVLVTGATADKINFESVQNGARSFRALYAVAIDPRLALTDASIEDRLNSVVIGHDLDENVAALLVNSNFQPTLRILRLLFGETNRDVLPNFFHNVPAKVWLNLYKSALGNEFLHQSQSAPSLVKLKTYLTELEFIKSNGRTIF